MTRTGYTGDRGYELWMPIDGALAVWDRIFEVGRRYGIHPVGIRAMDVARVEAGLMLIEVEYSSSHRAIAQEQHYSPFELGLGRLVDLGKASPFNGKRALLAEQAAGGPARRLVGLELEWAGIEGLFAKHDLAPAVSPIVHRDPVPVYKEGKQIGRATSITWGPTIKKMVGFGSVDEAVRAARHAPARSSGASRASAARWPPPSSRCRSSTSSASAARSLPTGRRARRARRQATIKPGTTVTNPAMDETKKIRHEAYASSTRTTWIPPRGRRSRRLRRPGVPVPATVTQRRRPTHPDDASAAPIRNIDPYNVKSATHRGMTPQRDRRCENGSIGTCSPSASR